MSTKTETHTKGPWQLGSELMRIETTPRFIVETGRAGEPYVAGVGPHGISEVEARANARLIAAAPDLLEALKGLLAHTEMRGDVAKLLAVGKAQKALSQAEPEAMRKEKVRG